MKFLVYITLIYLAAACTSHNTGCQEAVAEWIGREIVIPDHLPTYIHSQRLHNMRSDADFRIICYINSNGCTACRMKLGAWAQLINDFNTGDADVDFLMVLNTNKHNDIQYLLRRDNFLLPVVIDSADIFNTSNSLSSDESYHTFLLDADNRVVALGNPVLNPKVKDLYARIISGDASTITQNHMCRRPVHPLGMVEPGDTVFTTFSLVNRDTIPYHIQGIVPSCDCTSAVAASDTIPPKSSIDITVAYTGDTIPGKFSRCIDIFLNEKDNPEQLKIFGYINQ